MWIAAATAAILSHWYVLLFVIAIVTTAVKARRARAAHVVAHTPTIFWGELLFYVVGIGYVYAGIFHAYAQGIAAPAIGWAPSPFEYELGWMEIALGLVAMLALWRGRDFRLAATLIFVIFSWAAAAQHVQQLVCCANRAPGNAGTILWFGDLLIPLIVVIAAWLSLSDRS